MSGENWLWLFGVLAVGAAVLLFATPNVEPPVLPFVDAGLDMVINECSPVRLTCEGRDPNGGPVTYRWTAEGGRGSFDRESDLHPVYTTPEICGDCEDIVLTLTVTNEYGLSSSDSLMVRVCKAQCPLVLDPCYPVVPTPLGISTIPSDCSPECPLPVPVVNHAPHADAGEDITVNECASVRLTCSASDPDGDLVSCYWTAAGDRGSFDNPCVLHPIYTAPAVGYGGIEDVVLTLTVTDSCGASASDSLVARVTNVNHAPHADAGKDITVNECASVRLTCSASDPDGDPVSCYWTAAGGRGSFDNPCVLHPIYTAPAVGCGGVEDVVLTLTVTDSCGASASDSLVARVTNVNHAPYADAGEDITVSECTSVLLTCSASDPDGDPVSCYWTAAGDRGSFDNPCVLHPIYTAPAVGYGGIEDVVLTLTVTDSCGASMSDSLVARVTNVNQAPHADAGADITVSECTSVLLTCSASDPDGDPVSCYWTAAGDRGSFDNPCVLHPIYTAPAVGCGGVEDVVLTLTVTDSCGASMSDSLVARVTNVNQAPHADAGADITVNECASVRLTCSASDPDGDPVSCYWTAAGGRGSFDNPCVLHPIYTTPAVGCGGIEDVVLTLTVTDSCGASTSDSLIAYIRGEVPQPCPPTPPITETECMMKSVAESGCLQLHGDVCDVDGNLVRVWWTADKGRFSDPASLDPIYYAPIIDGCGDETVRIVLHAVDRCGAIGSDSFVLKINHINHAPTADAGGDEVVTACAKVRLTCSASDPDGDALTYHWTIEGGWGYLDNPYSLHPVYTAPALTECGEGREVVLTLTVTDTQGISASDSMIVHVLNPR